MASVQQLQQREEQREEQREPERAMPRISGEGMRSIVLGGPFLRTFWVASRSRPGSERTVYVLSSGRLSCDCPSSRHRGRCDHRRAVASVLAAEAQKTRRAEAQAGRERIAPAAPSVSPALIPAPLVNNKPFSLMK